MEKIIRSYNEISTDDSRLITGCAVKFNSESQDLGGYIETINASAITEDTIQNSDIFALLNHDEKDVLARCRYGSGSLVLDLKEDGLYYMFEAPNTEKGNELIEHIKRGEINTSSFAFSLPDDGSGERWFLDDNKVLRREILKIDKLFDVSPVYEAAYLATSCDKRALDKVNAIEGLNKKLDMQIEDILQYKINI